MTVALMLDTNAYYLFFQRPKSSSYQNIENHLKNGNAIEFFISEITSMEIHSVLCKHRRGIQPQKHRCTRMVIDSDEEKKLCSNEWIVPKKKKLNRRLFHDLQKIICDFESCTGDTKASVVALTPDALVEGRRLLMLYADKYKFGSLDALIAGSFICARKTNSNLLLATSDRSFKAMLKAESLPYYDPNETS